MSLQSLLVDQKVGAGIRGNKGLAFLVGVTCDFNRSYIPTAGIVFGIAAFAMSRKIVISQRTLVRNSIEYAGAQRLLAGAVLSPPCIPRDVLHWRKRHCYNQRGSTYIAARDPHEWSCT